jgi:hypothetical protein
MVFIAGVVTTASAHDYLAFKRTQWQAYSDLRKRVPAEHIDADWTLNGSAMLSRMIETPVQCWHMRQAYKIWPGYWNGYVTVASYHVPRWLPWDRGAPDEQILQLVGEKPHEWDPSCGR